MERVAALEPQLTTLGDLAPAMQELSTLREPLLQLAALGALMAHPILLLLVAVVALAAWGAVTFSAVRMAIVSAARATAARG